jgi:heme exporter protein CcmD
MEVFAMGDYGAYVWSSYFLTLIVVIVGMVQGKRRHRQITETVRRRLRLKESSE